MMRLILLRHAKARPGGAGMSDRDRPLAERGHRDARTMAGAIAEIASPDAILCSPSERTRETLQDCLPSFAGAPVVTMDEALYGGDQDAYLSSIAGQGREARRLLVIGHNPTVQQLALMLAKEPDTGMQAKFPTAAAAIFTFSGDDWAKLGPGKAKLVRFLRPKDF